MKRIALAAVLAAAAVGVVNAKFPAEVKQYALVAEQAAMRAWDGIAANPYPVGLAVGTFLVTVVYYKAKGKSLRESVEVAATRVTVVNVPAAPAEPETAVVARARARATRTQLIADQIGLQNRFRKLPEAVLKAEHDACYTEQAVADAERVLADRRKAHDEAVTKLDALRKEKALGEAELAEIEVELKKLAEVI
jgi:hypothetical protein